MIVSPSRGRLALAVGLLVAAASTASAQTPPSFEIRFRPPPKRPDTLPSAPMPEVAAVTTAEVPLAVVDQLDEAAKRAIEKDPSLRGLGTTQRAGMSATGWNWALTVKHADRTVFAPLIDAFAEKLGRCFYSLDNDTFTTNLAPLLSGIDASQPLQGKVAAGVMLANWKKDGCASRGTNDWPQHLLKLRGVTAWLLTEVRDRTEISDDDVALDVAEAVGKLFFDEGCGVIGACEPGGLWLSHWRPILPRAMDAIGTYLMKADDVAALSAPTYKTFWDWTLALVVRKPDALRSFAATVAAACVDKDTVDKEFRLQTCIDQGKVRMVPLRIGAAEYVAAGGSR